MEGIITSLMLAELECQGWTIVHWELSSPKVGDSIKELNFIGNQYAYIITAIGEDTFLARSKENSNCEEKQFKKYGIQYVYIKTQ